MNPTQFKLKIKQELEALGVASSLEESFQLLNPEALRNFALSIDSSDYTLNEWLQALLAFSKWAQEQKREISLSRKIDYLCCCVQGSNQAGKWLPLVEVWRHYLDHYGVSESD